jgi:hypothetical protein
MNAQWWFRTLLLLRTRPYCLFLSKWKANDHIRFSAAQSSQLDRSRAFMLIIVQAEISNVHLVLSQRYSWFGGAVDWAASNTLRNPLVAPSQASYSRVTAWSQPA